MNYAYLLTGGNLGNRAESLKNAVAMIAENAGNVLQLSSLYETAAWGTKDQPDYLNQAMLVETGLSATALLHTLLAIEKQLGRLRQEKYDARIIDIDILFFNNDVVHTRELIIPHPHLQNRRFVLVPMAEIAPAFRHPLLQKNISELLTNCADPLDVKKFYAASGV